MCILDLTYETIGVDPLDLNMEPLGGHYTQHYNLTNNTKHHKLRRHSYLHLLVEDKFDVAEFPRSDEQQPPPALPDCHSPEPSPPAATPPPGIISTVSTVSISIYNIYSIYCVYQYLKVCISVYQYLQYLSVSSESIVSGSTVIHNI